jgi:hypothetical protein
MGIAAILALVAQLVPVAQSLIDTLAKIKSQTEADHPEVWAKIRDDWSATADAWQKLVS